MSFLNFYHSLDSIIRKKLGLTLIDEKIKIQEDQILELRLELLKFTSCKYEAEVNYILKNGLKVFPYKQINNVEEIESGFDNHYKLPYVLHKQKRLYFPKSYTIDFCVSMYRSYIGDECLLGGKYREKQPHQYLTESFCVEEGDVLVDVGCAEALLSLDSIDKVRKVYLFEADPIWLPALKATFKDYSDKVILINKYVSDKDSNATITLKTALKDEYSSRLFIKMDIEGAELSVLKGSKDFFKNRSNVKLACCTYHKYMDEIEIPVLMEEMGYNYEFSDGYMLFLYAKDIRYPYFRHGLVRAKNF